MNEVRKASKEKGIDRLTAGIREKVGRKLPKGADVNVIFADYEAKAYCQFCNSRLMHKPDDPGIIVCTDCMVDFSVEEILKTTDTEILMQKTPRSRYWKSLALRAILARQ